MKFSKFQKLVKALGIKEAYEMAVEELGSHEKALAMIDGQEVVDADGNAIDIQTIDLGTGGGNAGGDGEETPPEGASMTPKQIAELAAKAATEVFKAASKSGEIRITGGDFRNDDTKRWGWKHVGEQAAAIVKFANTGQADERLKTGIKASLSTYASEGIGEDGGFPIAPDFQESIQNKIDEGDSLAARCNRITTSKNSVVITKDETTPWQSSGGILAYWDGEADTITQSKPKLKQDLVRLNKLTALVPVTDEAAEDAPFLLNHINTKAPQKLGFKLDLAILQGTGAGQPLGVINAPATISVAKEGSQVADTIVALNVLKMLNRQLAALRTGAVFVAHQDTEVVLQTLMKQGKLDTGGADTGWGITVPFFTYADDGTPRLANKEVVFHEACETLGDLGDIILANFSQYDLITKSGGIKADSSMHLWFDQSVQALRFVMRVAGQPSWSSSVSARDGSTTYSPFVTLAERG